MKNIALILHPYGERHAAGLGRAIESLARELITANPDWHFTVFLKGDEVKFGEYPNVTVKYLKPSLFWLDKGLQNELDLDLYIFFTPVMPLWIKPKKSLVIVHDMGPRRITPQNTKEWVSSFLLRIMHKRAFKLASLIVAVSEYTKSEILYFYPKTSLKNIKVIYNGFHDLSNLICKEIKVAKPFFLFVGVMKKRKNISRIIEAFEVFKKNSSLPHHLLLVGKKSAEIERRVGQSAWRNEISFCGYISDEELAYLYRECTAFVFPSLLEGFGMPVLEAMQNGAPVITSNRDALKEIGGEAALLVNPLSTEEIAQALIKVATNIDLSNELKEKGKVRASGFSWSKAASDYGDEIRKLI